MRGVLDGPVGWVLLSREAVARAEEALGPNDRGVRDEVGFLALHQGFADRFFPGTSVLHTRLKYLLFVPWLMEMVAERGGTDYASRFAAAETELSGQLLRQENPDGVIGGRIWPRPPAAVHGVLDRAEDMAHSASASGRVCAESSGDTETDGHARAATLASD